MRCTRHEPAGQDVTQEAPQQPIAMPFGQPARGTSTQPHYQGSFGPNGEGYIHEGYLQ